MGEEPELPEPVIFGAITAETIAKAAAKVKGAHGPSGGDAENWKRQLCSFGPASVSLCDSIAAVTRRLCTTFLDPTITSALLASRLLPFKKKNEGETPQNQFPEFQVPQEPQTLTQMSRSKSHQSPTAEPSEFGEVLRRIIGKDVVTILRKDIVQAIGTINLCAGQKAAPETIIHLMDDLLQEDDCEGLLLVDGTCLSTSQPPDHPSQCPPPVCPRQYHPYQHTTEARFDSSSKEDASYPLMKAQPKAATSP